MSIEETIMQLRREIELLLPGWKVWTRLDISDFQFFGWNGSIKNCIQSQYYYDSNIPTALEVATDMRVNLEHMNRLAKQP